MSPCRRSPGWSSVQTQVAERNGALCTNALSRWYNQFSSKATPPLMILVWFKNGYRCRPTSNSWLAAASAGYEPHRGYVEWGEEDNVGHVACPPSQKWRWAMDPCVRRVEWSCFVSALRSITDATNEISGRSTGVLDFLLNFWRRNYFFLILAHSVYKMWIIQEPNKLELWNKLHFKEEKTESIHHF